MMTRQLALTRLLQLCSANLPVGGFSFSQGLEQAVELGWVDSADSTYNWCHTYLRQAMLHSDLPLLAKQFDALQDNNSTAFSQNESWIRATRESSELLMADQAMGKAMLRLLTNLDELQHSQYYSELQQHSTLSFISSFALAACFFDMQQEDMLTGFAWAYIDNQIAAATKLVPLGQTQSQNLLFKLATVIPHCVTDYQRGPVEELGQSLVGLSMASSWHEQQYSRLFRS
jgi:urease accessory protein